MCCETISLTTIKLNRGTKNTNITLYHEQERYAHCNYPTFSNPVAFTNTTSTITNTYLSDPVRVLKGTHITHTLRTGNKYLYSDNSKRSRIA
jgi:hypothetical protein